MTDLHSVFLVVALNPANGRAIEFLLFARSDADAKRIAEEIGMLNVLVKPATGNRTPQLPPDPP